MRLLFTFTGGNGHFLPTLSIAQAAAARGHQIAFSCQSAMLGTVEAAGFPAIDSGGRTLADPTMRGPLLPVDRAVEERVIRDTFAGRTARERAARLLTVAGDCRPDVIVRDEVDFGAAVAAERLRIPHVSVVVLAAGGMIRPDLVAEPLDALRAAHGLAADPQAAMLHRYLTVVPVPPSYRTPADPLPPTAMHIRPSVLDPAVATAAPDPAWSDAARRLDAHTGRPTVYFTLGTVFHQESGDLFTRALAGLRALDANIIVTVGREIDPAELGEQPDNVHIATYIPQQLLLPRCDLVVSHAGSGSVIGSLACGLPLVLLPMGADQPLNADRCDALGVGVVLDPITAGQADISRAAAAVLGTASYQKAATRLRTEIARLPGPDAAVAEIEKLAS